MKSKVVEDADVVTYEVVCDPGDEAVAALAQSARSEQLKAAQIIAIGAFERATVGWFDCATREYRRIPVDQQCELLSFVGDVAVGEDGPVAHMHVVLVADLTLPAVLATAAGLLGGPPLSAPTFVMSRLVAIAVFEPFGGLAHPVVALERERAAATRLSELFPATPEHTTMHDPWPGGIAPSGGERRRLSVAQGLLRNRDILLLDEPTEALDTATAVRLLAGVRELLPTTVPVRRPPRPSITRCAVARRRSDRAPLAAQSCERRRSVGWLRP